MRKLKSNTAMLMALAAGLGYRVEGRMAESYGEPRNQKPSRYAAPASVHEQDEAMRKAEEKRQRKAAKRKAANAIELTGGAAVPVE